MTDVFDVQVVARSTDRLIGRLEAFAPALANPVREWTADRFLAPFAFPTVRLPTWIARAAGRPLDSVFHDDVTYSTICGSYAIYLGDQVMDGDAPRAARQLPLLAVLHTEFVAAYHPWFPADHGFWHAFRTHWFETSEAVFRELRGEVVDEKTFDRVAARKLGAAKIPVAASCHYLGVPDMIDAWSTFCGRLGALLQMMDDLFDWRDDARRGVATHVLAQARRRRHREESLPDWMEREGWEWGCTRLRGMIDAAERSADALASMDVSRYIKTLAASVEQHAKTVGAGLHELRKVVALFTAEPRNTTRTR